MLPVDVVLRTCTASDLDAALADGEIVEVEFQGGRAVALVDLAESEEMLADGLASLAAENRLAVVVGPHAVGRSQALATALGGVPAVVLEDAHTVGVDDVLAAVEDLPEDSVLALSLDPALPLAAVPGAVALDLASSGACPVLKATMPPARTALARARADVAAGHWFGTSAADRSIVEVRVSGPDEALVRVGQLVGTSIPRAFDVPASEIAVLLAPGSLDPAAVQSALSAAGGEGGGSAVARAAVVPLAGAAAGAAAAGPAVVPLAGAAAGAAAAGPAVVPLAGPLDRAWDAAVLVLGPPGPGFTRALVYAGLMAGEKHVSVVHGAEPAALAAAMSGAPDRPRRTRLAALLSG
ncbi:MAG: hypothetical protein AB7V23_15350 [Candidatus Nanopelagicales bacterium]